MPHPFDRRQKNLGEEMRKAREVTFIYLFVLCISTVFSEVCVPFFCPESGAEKFLTSDSLSPEAGEAFGQKGRTRPVTLIKSQPCWGKGAVEMGKILSLGEVQRMTFPQSDWVWDGVVRTGRRRPTLGCGKAESGKSTLLRNLATAVSKGEDFLGRKTKRCEVFFFHTEDELADIKMFFDALGYDERTDERIHLVDFDVAERNLKTFGAALDELPDVGLICIESMTDLLNVKDINDNSQVREAFLEFEDVISSHVARAGFVGLCHLKKTDCDDPGDAISGASELRARSDGKIYLQAAPGADGRIISIKTRVGTDLQKTLLDFDPVTHRVSLGKSFSEIKREEFVSTQQEIEQSIIEYLMKNPNITREDCIRAVRGNTKRKHEAWVKLERVGAFSRTGKGIKNDPALYAVAELPVEVAA